MLKVNEFVNDLRRRGAELLRQKGSHMTFKLPSGQCVTVLARTGKRREVQPWTARKIYRMLEQQEA